MKTLYLVTGAAGHLGTTICKQLISEKKRIRALVLPNDPSARFIPEEVEKIYGDILNINSLEEFFSNSNNEELIVIHCAGIVSIASHDNPKIYDVNVNGTKNIVDFCEKKRVAKLIYVSSVHAIPEEPRGTTISEISDFDPNEVNGLYAKTKAMATKLVLDSGKRGFPVCVVHPSGIIGPNDYGHSHLTQLVVDYYSGKLPAGVDGGYDFVDVRDVAKGIIACCDKGRNGECYILSNQYYKISDVLSTLHEVTGKRKIRTMLPHWFAKIFAPFAEMFAKLSKKPPLFTSYSLYTLASNSAFSHKKADSELNYRTTPFKKTITDTVNWLKKIGRLK